MGQILNKSLLILILAFAFTFKGNQAQALEPIRIATGDWAPYLGKKLKEKGMANHIVAEAFKASGVEIKWGFFPWSRALKTVKRGRDWDATTVWYGTDERRKEFYLSDNVVEIGHVLFYLKSTCHF